MPPGTRNALVPPSPNYLASAGQFVSGVGRGLGTQFVTAPLQLVQQSYEDPYSLGQGIYEGARGLVADPVGVVGNSLRGMWNRAKSSPAGLGEVVGENIDPRNWLKPRKALRQELDVYHGTPHTFDPETGAPLGRFRSEKIGTGEGAQAYGHGLYLAESPGVAKEYQVKLSSTGSATNAVTKYRDIDSAIKSTEESISNYRNAIESGVGGERVKGMLQVAEKTMNDLRDIKAGKPVNKGSLYKVDLPDAKIEQMLDWDKPISQQPAMQKAFTKFWKGLSKDERAQAVYEEFGDYDLADQMAKSPGEVRGRLAYTLMTHHFGDQAAASDFLRQQGIPGIKYLDAGSRAGEKGTRNFVVFPGEEQHLNILSRD